MGLDVKTLAASKKYTKETATGGGAIQGQPGKDGKDAPTITTVDVDENNVLLTTLSDGTTLNGGTIKTVSGTDGVDGQNGTDGENGITPHIDSVTKHWFIGTTDTGIVAEGKDGSDGVQGIKGDKGEAGSQGIQGIQGIKGDKGDDGYPFLIYKEYTSLDNFNNSDFPEIGLMFMIKVENATTLPVYRYTGETKNPYSFVTNLSGSEIIKGDKGDPGTPGEQGIPGQNGKDGTTYIPTIGTVTSIDSNQNATATVTINETEKIAKFNFEIPNGKDGEDGTDGFAPTIKENSGNTEDCYRLDIENKDKKITTPNLMGVIGMEYKNKSVGTPVGEIISFMGTIAPENYLICDGTVYQIDDYPILAQHFADNFGSKNYFGGDGTTTFAVPDLRGEFLRGTGTATRNTGGGASVGIHQNGTTHIRIGYNRNDPSFWIDGANNFNGSVSTDGDNFDKDIVISSGTGRAATLHNWSGAGGHVAYTSRPTNTSVLYCIKYQPTYWITPTNE